MPHVSGRDELALLDVDDLPGAAGSYEQIGLAAKERWNLKNVHIVGSRFRVCGLMNVRQHLKPCAPQAA
jgi:hypothetical protein